MKGQGSTMKKIEIHNFFSPFLQKIKWGFYSVNKVLFFFLICITLILLLLSASLHNAVLKIENKYLKEIYSAVTKPISDFSAKYRIDSVIPKIRKRFLSAAQLTDNSNWDNFYYVNTNEIGIHSKNEVSPLPDTQPEVLRLAEDIAELETKLEFLKDTLSELKKVNAEQPFDITLKVKTEEKFAADISVEEATLLEKDKLAEDKSSASSLQKTIDTHMYAYTKEKPLRVLMIGDSQMRSIAGGFMRLVGESAPIKITEVSVPSSGFIRGDYYNWPKKLQSIFTENKNTPFDIAIMFLGMNDYQNFYDGEGNVLVKETPKWEAAYSEKIKKHLDILFAHTKKVYWLGMPVVRNKVYNADLSYIEKIQKKIASYYSAEQLIQFSLSSAAPGEGVPYTDTLQTPEGKKIKLMRDDGTHYTISGGEYIMTSFLELLYTHWDIEPLTERAEKR